MAGVGRYLRLLGAFARFALANEMAFRANYCLRVLVEVLWLGILLVFYQVIFRNTNAVAGWDEHQYLFFLGCYYALEGLIETFFLESCSEFADLVRTGNLDLYLLRPIDEQFLVTCRHIDWSTAPKVLLGGGVMAFALDGLGWPVGPLRAGLFVLVFGCGVALAYSFLLLLTASSVWMMRSQSLMELWWLLTTLMRYPREIYRGGWAGALGFVCWYLLPVMLVINVPAAVLVRGVLDPWNVVLIVAAAAVMLYLSRRFFFRALRSYRSASS
jgi:ABC-2 type transport system permease protein